MRPIRRDEVRSVAEMMADSFTDYPLYGVFFPDGPRKRTQVFYYFWYRVYTRRNFTYINDDMDFMISVQQPGDKACSPWGLLLNPRFMFGFLWNIPLRALKRTLEYTKMEDIYKKRYYDPAVDSDLQAMCVLKSSRGSGALLRGFRDMDRGQHIYCVTHSARNARLFQLLGAEQKEAIPWHGVTHYVLRRDPDREKGQESTHE